ncbi:GerW family sporulation protein [Actinotalea sp. K2]|uniref:GerW family sporulation protein n=1 Tax=Actinotalea sp. K2 TaxID=2939438 RepID=UPI0020182D49|nr:spore germination protein GerW family protein [Actinotalea sp. K2]MCL3860097.1 hypothetical protein [Actinotalea sp. K2]
MATSNENDETSDRHEDRSGHDAQRARRGGRRGGAHGLITRTAGDALSVRRAFGTPVQHGDVTLVPVASVAGGSGSGYGTAEVGGDAARGASRGDGTGTGGGGGFGLRVHPIGVYVVQGAQVRWQPALDLGRVILGGQVVGAVAVIALSWAIRGRRR